MTPQQFLAGPAAPAGPEASEASAGPAASTPEHNVPLLSVSRGNPTPEELAAVTAVILALQGAAETSPRGASTRHWVRRARLHVPPQPGAGAWRRSAK